MIFKFRSYALDKECNIGKDTSLHFIFWCVILPADTAHVVIQVKVMPETNQW